MNDYSEIVCLLSNQVKVTGSHVGCQSANISEMAGRRDTIIIMFSYHRAIDEIQ